MTTVNLTREEMIQRLIEDYYDGMDYNDLYSFVEYYMEKQYADYTDQELDTEYTERFEESWLIKPWNTNTTTTYSADEGNW